MCMTTVTGYIITLCIQEINISIFALLNRQANILERRHKISILTFFKNFQQMWNQKMIESTQKYLTKESTEQLIISTETQNRKQHFL